MFNSCWREFHHSAQTQNLRLRRRVAHVQVKSGKTQKPSKVQVTSGKVKSLYSSLSKAWSTFEMATQEQKFLDRLFANDGIIPSLGIVEKDHFEIESNVKGLHQSAGDINSQVYDVNRRIRDHILQQQGSGSEKYTARTSTNIPSEGDDY
ncbi:hypothetical protein OS493_020917 [Desmophyllum pertusum]|uniref:Uncharacterized protein n=1 Tax=Desmophyllum pertusum TaxID=174260 RepID=A0A9X0D843_9CNID|nr:hypothetical protein OS493_020917 [Desmophyllum pertusum]